ncbi:anoctamin-like protein [Achlya hypogyna]|uniref:Anoctamin-like protein n=1 Tax=Achlya hypogyna TaxID=1202772 RepID=A0A1V9YDR8_ACHHY|nr:anoctamin-like protein [Achlya hypogyna]
MHEICVYAEVLAHDGAAEEGSDYPLERLSTFAHVLKDKGLDTELLHVADHHHEAPDSHVQVYLLLLGISKTAQEEQILATLSEEHQYVRALPGSARTQQVVLALLREAAVDDNLYLGQDGLTLAFHAGEKLFPQLQAHLQVSLLPLHNEPLRHDILRKWHAAPALALPFREIHSYFGPALSMYFVWLDFYTQFLVVPSICGVALFLMEAAGMDTTLYILPFSIVLSMSTSIFVDSWKRQQRKTEYQWQYTPVDDTYGEPRPAFVGEWIRDPVTHELVFDAPPWKRSVIRACVTLPLVLLMCVGVLVYVLGLEWFADHNRHWFPECYDNIDENDVRFCAMIIQGPSLLNAALIEVMDLLYLKLARWLTRLENYRTVEEHDNQLILKRMPFHLINCNASLLYLAFVAQDLTRLRRRLWILMVGMQCLDNVKEVAMPSLMLWFQGGFATHDHRVHSTADDKVEHILLQKRQTPYKDTFSDYKEMMLQYGYVTLYAPVFPLAPLFAYLNNLIEARSDFFKLVNNYGLQRPYAKHAHGIGIWSRVLYVISVVAVLVNCGLLGIYQIEVLAPDMSDLHRCCLIFFLEHVILLVKVCVDWSNPDVPTWTAIDERRRFLNTQASAKKHLLKKAA